MQLHEKIKQVREEKKLSREDLYLRLKEIFGSKTIKPNSIWRIESGLTSARASSLHQICVGLGVSLKELLAGITQEKKLIEYIKKNKRIDNFVYNDKAKADILSSSGLSFMAQELTLSPGGSTAVEEDPIEVGKFQKWVYCLSGKITCAVGTEKQELNKGDCISFESNIPHNFENTSSRKSRCIIVQNPKYV